MPRVIDVAGLPAPTLVDAAYGPIKAARLASLRARYLAAGIDWDVHGLETDPGVILQEEDGYREVLDRTAINDAVKRVLPAFAVDGDLDQLTAFNNTERLVTVPADPVLNRAAVLETNAALLRRYLAGFSRPAAGSEPGYEARALDAYPLARDVRVFRTTIDGAPRVNVVLLGQDGPAPIEAVRAVYAAFQAPGAAPLTAAVSVYTASVVSWGLRARLTIPKGPDPSLVVDLAKASLLRLDEDRFRIGGELPANAPAGALYVPNVLRVDLLAPFAGVEAAPAAAPRLDLAALDLQWVIAG